MLTNNDFTEFGEVARLIPVIADNRKEQRATSIFLATFAAVPDFARVLLGQIGRRLGKTTIITTRTEVEFKSADGKVDRPDGLIVLTTGKNRWTALVEAKIGRANIEPEQVLRYARIAREYGIDAVITISNQLTARPQHNVVEFPAPLQRWLEVFHFSWSHIVTEAMLLTKMRAIEDPDQAFILREFFRFVSDPSVGIEGFKRMPTTWKSLVDIVKAGGSISKSSPETIEVVRAWHQECVDMNLQMSRHLAVPVELKLSKRHESDKEYWLEDDCADLSKKDLLEAKFEIPNAAGIINIVIDLRAQVIRIGMVVDAPMDRVSAVARANWLVRQLQNADTSNMFVRLIWPSRKASLVLPMAALKDDTKFALANVDGAPRAFEIFLVCDDSSRFPRQKPFIEMLEAGLPKFYDNVSQHVKRWVAPPPKPVSERDDVIESQDVNDEEIKPEAHFERLATEKTLPGNQHTDLLEIPDFLIRLQR